MLSTESSSDSSPSHIGGGRFANLISSKASSPSLKSSNPTGPNGKQMLSSLNFNSFSMGPVTAPPKLSSKRRGLRSTAPKTANLQRHRNERKKFGTRRPYSINA